MSPGEGGFTLIEMMVVIFLVGLLAGVVVLSTPGEQAAVRDDADRFALHVAAARDEAVLRSQPIALWISPSGYGFEGREAGAWRPIDTPPLAAADWRSGTSARIPAEGQRLVFDSVGLPSEAIAIAIEQGGARRVVSISATGEVSIDG